MLDNLQRDGWLEDKAGHGGPWLATAVEPSEWRVRPARPLVPAWGWLAGVDDSRKFAVCTYFSVLDTSVSQRYCTQYQRHVNHQDSLGKLQMETSAQRSLRNRKGKIFVHQVGVTK